MKIGSIATPLVVEEWEAALKTHPVQFLLKGLRRGFRIGFDRANQLRSVPKNMQPARDHPGCLTVPRGGSGCRTGVCKSVCQLPVGTSAISVSSQSHTSRINGD